MKQIYINQYEKVVSDDINQAQLAMAQSMQDDFLYRFFGEVNGCCGSDLAVSYVSALAGSIAVGTAFMWDAAQTGNTPKYRMIKAATAIPFTLTAADGTHDRIDRICLAPNFAVTGTSARFVKAGGTGAISSQTVTKIQEMTYTLTVVAGTPGASPSAPATPAGNISLATVLVTAITGMSGSGAVTDTRTVLALAFSSTGHILMTGGTNQLQLDQADAALVTNNLVAITTGTTLSKASHAGRLLQLDSTSAAFNLTLPALSVNTGIKCILSDYKGQFGTNAVTLIPNGTDKIMGLNSNYLLESAWGQWELFSDASGWYLL